MSLTAKASLLKEDTEERQELLEKVVRRDAIVTWAVAAQADNTVVSRLSI